MDPGLLAAVLVVIFIFCLIYRINPVKFVASLIESWQKDRDEKDQLRFDTINAQKRAIRATDLLNRVFGLEEEFAYLRLGLPEPQGITITEELERIKLAAMRIQQDFELVQSVGNPERQKLSTNKLLIQRIAFNRVTTDVENLTSEMDGFSSQFRSLADQQSQPQLPQGSVRADQAQERSSK